MYTPLPLVNSCNHQTKLGIVCSVFGGSLLFFWLRSLITAQLNANKNPRASATSNSMMFIPNLFHNLTSLVLRSSSHAASSPLQAAEPPRRHRVETLR